MPRDDSLTSLTTIHTPPSLDAYTPLVEHQEQTPASFFTAKPVLHHHAVGAHAVVRTRSEAERLKIFGEGDGEGPPGQASWTTTVDVYVGTDRLTLFNTHLSIGISIPYPAISLHAIQTQAPEATAAEADDDAGAGAVQSQGLFMQLELSDPFGVGDGDDDDDMEMSAVVEVTLILGPEAEAQAAVASERATVSSSASIIGSDPAARDVEIVEGTTSTTTVAWPRPQPPIQALFDAVSACSNLHPDAFNENMDSDEEMGMGGGIIGGSGGGFDNRILFEGTGAGMAGYEGMFQGAVDGALPPPFPGSGGWITAENVDQFFDAEGQWIGGEDPEGEGDEQVTATLGEGAGRVRLRDEVEEADGVEAADGKNGASTVGVTVNGHGDEDESHKRTRVE